MSRIYSLRNILRQLPKPELGRFFERMNFQPPDLDWNRLRRFEFQPILDAMSRLGPDQSVRIEGELRRIFNLACESGWNALIDCAAACGDHKLTERVPEEGTNYERTLAAWFDSPHLFEDAELHMQIDGLSWWRRRNDLPRRPPNLERERLNQLGDRISQFLLTQQGRGRVCTVEYLERDNRCYVFVHPDDFVQSVHTHDEERRLIAHPIRRTFEIVFAFESASGALELYAKLPGKLKPLLEEMFVAELFDCELGPWTPPAAFQLSHLRLRSTRLAVDPADGVSVFLRRLRFDVPNTRRRLDFEADPELGREDLHIMIEDYLDRRRIRVEELRVRAATLVFTFQATNERKAGRATVEIGAPNTSNLHHLSPERAAIIGKYLRLWSIDVRPCDSSASASSGHGTAAVA